MFVFVITIHIITCALLILIVLVQQGRGGGLIDSLSSAESIFGTKTNTFLIKLTTVLAVVFFVTCLSLAFLSIRKNESLTLTTRTKPAPTATATSGEATTAAMPTQETKTKPSKDATLPPVQQAQNTPAKSENK